MLPLLASGSLTLAPNNSSVNGQLPAASGGTRLRISNLGGTVAYYKLGSDNTVTADATSASVPIPPNTTIECARNPKGHEWIAVYSTASVSVAIATGST